ncbi:hypothetical protein FRC02_008614 [Tulasnella sp. 418]|nr:hypothetical protein FRC02_008614 [Tulasnella sp. 418]
MDSSLAQQLGESSNRRNRLSLGRSEDRFRRQRPFAPQYNWNSGNDGYRRETGIRATILALISDCMIGNLTGAEKLAMLQDIEHSCTYSSESAGVPFGELLGIEMEKAGVPPLLWEIQTTEDADAGGSGELIRWLVTKTVSPKVGWMIRTGCRSRGDNGAFQILREFHRLEEGGDGADYDVIVNEEDENTFHAIITIENFEETIQKSSKPQQDLEEAIRRKVAAEYRRIGPVDASTRLRPTPKIETEWIVGGRAWRLDVTEEGLDLVLLEGGPGVVTARLAVISADLDRLQHDRNQRNVEEDPFSGAYGSPQTQNLYSQPWQALSAIQPTQFSDNMELTFPRGVMMHPLSSRGKNQLSLRPSWGFGANPSSWYAMVMQSGELMLRLDIEIAQSAQPEENRNTQTVETKISDTDNHVAVPSKEKSSEKTEVEVRGADIPIASPTSAEPKKMRETGKNDIEEDDWEDINDYDKNSEGEDLSNDDTNWVNV